MKFRFRNKKPTTPKDHPSKIKALIARTKRGLRGFVINHIRNSTTKAAEADHYPKESILRGAMDDISSELYRFTELPEAIRFRIWTYAAYVPRVVELHEHLSSTYRHGKDEPHTNLRSRTRPLALPQVCAEARRVALQIYLPLYKQAHNSCVPYTPIYANPISDITYRGVEAEPFRLFGPNHQKDIVPLGATRKLAVNIRVLEDYRPSRKSFYTTALLTQLMHCAENGLSVLILVLGNEEDHAEFELEDVDPSCVRTKDALCDAASLRAALNKHWLHRTWQSSAEIPTPPVISVMKVKCREDPDPPFHYFSKLPQELQNQVWLYASNTRRIISTETHFSLDDGIARHTLKFTHRRAPPLLSVCKASRSIAMKKLTLLPGTTLSKPGWYNKSLDVVVAPRWDRPSEAFQKFDIKYLGMPYLGSSSNALDPPFIQQIKGLKKVIIIIGSCHRNSEFSLVSITEPYEKSGTQITFSARYCQARDKTYQLRGDMDKYASKWNTLQEKKEERGEEREPNWSPPAIKAARMVPVSHVLCPYSNQVDKQTDEL